MTETEKYVRERSRRDQEFKAAIEETETAHAWSLALIRARIDAGLTQAQLAERLGTRQPAIARLEAARTTPSINILMRYAKVLGVRFEVGGDQVEVVRPAA
ncbi:MAG TPA: helix-turn-helix transcriptional regulator [Chloroflexota bacterium]|jgi:DNA-binding XRE family transcriptional regulator|nr:helix-turn-helix transcriptional regulator [Chloroflexota bacterium]